MIALVAAAIGLLAAFPGAAPAAAQERILSYDTEIRILPDGALDITERITVRAEGDRIRRGIYRDFPTRYRDRYGNRVRVGFEVVEVLRDGAPEPWFTERLSNGVRINTGDDTLLGVPATYTFTLRYRTTRQLGFFEAHDELYWNAIGTGWVFPIESGTVEVTLPEPVPVEAMSAEGYTGAEGAQGDDYEAGLPAPGRATYRLTAPLEPGEGFTIVLTFPKGVVREPGALQRAAWLLVDNRGILVALAGLAALLAFCVSRWRRVGRDPRPGVIIPRYEPPPGETPGGLRYLRRMAYDPRCFTADILALAVAGHLRIGTTPRRLRRDVWYLERTPPRAAPAPPPLSEAQRLLLEELFPRGKERIELRKDNAAHLSRVRVAHSKALRARYQPRYFRRNEGSVAFAVLLAIASTFAAVAVADGSGIPAIIALAVLSGLAVAVFSRLVRAPTPEGRALLDHAEGLALYLSVAERDELAALGGPGEPPRVDAERYERLLPFAVALDVEEAWTEKFTAAVGAAAAEEAAARMAWYGGGPRFAGIGAMTKAVGSTLTSQIAAASTPPGSGSGAGGGGSVGGGGGGGGGGGR